MTARILEGPPVADSIDRNTLECADKLRSLGVNPTLAIVRVGSNESDIAYERGASRRAEKVGVNVSHVLLDPDTSQDGLISAIQKLNDDADVHGILLLRPLPNHLDEATVCNSINPDKDVDASTDVSLSSLFTGKDIGFAPCTAEAVLAVLNHYDIEVEGRNVVVVGRSLVIGKPVAMMLLDQNATVTISHSRSRELASITQAADIVVACVGRSQMLEGEYFSDGQCVIDVGINFTDDGRMTGDVDYDKAASVVGAITPVPRGVGSVTTSILLRHVVQAAEAACTE